LKCLFCFSMDISKKTLKYCFDPCENQQETHLLYELQWGEALDTVGIPHGFSHAESYFLKNVFKRKRFINYVNNSITWYLSWSCCACCCYEIQKFLKKHSYVNINIHVAWLHCIENEEICSSLMDLKCFADVTIAVISQFASVSPDYTYCWKKFFRGNADDHAWSVDFESRITMYRLRLKNVFEVSRL
ncbi:ABEC1 enzyme, partial [Anseranas semipalmata]|nr:ABEC1 enzyme [Anseranas semipalmata]